MSYSFTATETKTFTLTHAKHLAAKVTADLKRLQRLYGDVSDERIAQFEGEAAELLRQGYLGTVTYGFKRDGSWIEPTLRYTASDLANGGTDDDPGRVRPGINISGASFHSYLTYSSAWWALTPISAQPSNDNCRCSEQASQNRRSTATSPDCRLPACATRRIASRNCLSP